MRRSRGRTVQVGDTLYRSNAEALWGEYLVECGMEPQHEPFYVLSQPSYLPDFYVPQLNTVIEVKRGHVGTQDLAKRRAAVRVFAGRVQFVVLDGVPPGRWHLVLTESTIPDTIPELVKAWMYGRWPEIPWDHETFRNAKDRVTAHADAPVIINSRPVPTFDKWLTEDNGLIPDN